MVDPRFIREGSIEHLTNLIARLNRMIEGSLEAVGEDPDRFQTLVKSFLKEETKILEATNGIDDKTRAKLRPPIVAESIVVHAMAWASASMAATAADLNIQLPSQDAKRATFESICRINIALYMTLINKAMEHALGDTKVVDDCIADNEAPKDKGKIH